MIHWAAMSRRLLLPLLLLAALLPAACGEADDGPAGGSSSAAVREVDTGVAALLDVRTREERQESYAAGSEHLALADLEEGDRPNVAKDARLYVYCRTGRRAAIAAELLRREGWRDVVNVGGLADWQRAGGAVVRR